jgi:hypothetical protein
MPDEFGTFVRGCRRCFIAGIYARCVGRDDRQPAGRLVLAVFFGTDAASKERIFDPVLVADEIAPLDLGFSNRPGSPGPRGTKRRLYGSDDQKQTCSSPPPSSMKAPFLFLSVAILTLTAVSAFAQVSVTTGTVTAVVKESGAVTVLSDQTHRPISYTAMDKAVVQFASGKVATIADVAVGQHVAVEYTVNGNALLVGKFLLPDPKPAAPVANAPALATGERKGLTSKAARDNDITTQPGSKARTDRDITTQPGTKDPKDSDITRKRDK